MTYMLIHPAAMAAALDDYEVLVARFAAREVGSEEVLIDALLEVAEWSHPNSWAKAREMRDKRPELNMFWVGNGRIRQNVIRLTPGSLIAPGTYRVQKRRGWREIDATARVRRAVQKRTK